MPRPSSDLEDVLLVAAADVIASDGLDALSLRDLARRAGVSRAAPYHYFRDKDDLLARAGALGVRRLGERIAAASKAQTDPLLQLRAGLIAYVEYAQSEAQLFRLMFSGVLERNAAAAKIGAEGDRFAFSSASARDAFRTLVDAIQRAQEEKRLRDGDPLLIANVFWAYTHGIAVLAQGSHIKHRRGGSAVFDAGFTALLAHYSAKPKSRRKSSRK